MEATLQLARSATSPSLARAWLTSVFATMSAQPSPELLLVSSELVTNAVRYGEPPISATVSVEEDGVRLSVHDAGHAPINRRPPEDLSENGRGLNIVGALSTTWGIETDGGHTVWARLRLDDLRH